MNPILTSNASFFLSELTNLQPIKVRWQASPQLSLPVLACLNTEGAAISSMSALRMCNVRAGILLIHVFSFVPSSMSAVRMCNVRAGISLIRAVVCTCVSLIRVMCVLLIRVIVCVMSGLTEGC